MTAGTIDRVRVVTVGEQGRGTTSDVVVVEEPLRVVVESGGRTAVLATTMRTPGHDIELAVGLATAEGVIRKAGDVWQVRPCGLRDGVDLVTVHLAEGLPVPDDVARVGTTSSACGMCGREAIEQVLALCLPVPGTAAVTVDFMLSLPSQMAQGQKVFRRTGGLHAAGVGSLSGIAIVREDVGRHNAVDKSIGAAVLAGTTPSVLVTSGRAGFEILQKAAMAGIDVVASVSAPTSMAVELAARCGILLAGFVREDRLNVYAGAERLQ